MAVMKGNFQLLQGKATSENPSPEPGRQLGCLRPPTHQPWPPQLGHTSFGAAAKLMCWINGDKCRRSHLLAVDAETPLHGCAKARLLPALLLILDVPPCLLGMSLDVPAALRWERQHHHPWTKRSPVGNEVSWDVSHG